MILVIDEIDSFSKSMSERSFKRFLKKMLNFGDPKKPSILPKASKGTTSQSKREETKQSPRNKRKQKQLPKEELTYSDWMPEEVNDTRIAVTVIGIANSVELFQGELNAISSSAKSASDIVQKSAYITKNEQKLLFRPYTAEDLAKIVFNLYREHLRHFVNQKRRFRAANGKDSAGKNASEEFKQLEAYQIMHPKAFTLAAGKVDKLSGDIRVCFEILRESVQRKLDQLRTGGQTYNQKITLLDVNDVIVDRSESKLLKMVKKLPRTHILLLKTLVGCSGNDIVKESFLLQLYNQTADKLMIERLTAAELNDII